MKNEHLIEQLKSHIPVIQHLLLHVEDEIIKWRPESQKWCLLEIICHLVDEEKYDFKKRIKLALFPNESTFEGIDPKGWVLSKNYLKQDYQKKIWEWIEEREESVRWLKEQISQPWENTFIHPELGKMSAQQMLNNWLAHDYIHIRQITQLKRAYLNEKTKGGLEYAGRW